MPKFDIIQHINNLSLSLLYSKTEECRINSNKAFDQKRFDELVYYIATTSFDTSIAASEFFGLSIIFYPECVQAGKEIMSYPHFRQYFGERGLDEFLETISEEGHIDLEKEFGKNLRCVSIV